MMISKVTNVKTDTNGEGIMIYGYARISTKKQNIERQIRNIKASYPEVVIVQEVYTGTKFQERKEFVKLEKKAQAGDIIVFDAVSRMARNADEGFDIYQKLFERGVDLVFLKEPHVDTSVYKNALDQQIEMTGGMVDEIIEGVNKFLMRLAKEQIRIAFEQAEKEVTDLRQRTKEGIQTARLQGKQIGQKPGNKLTTKKSIDAKRYILAHNKDFGGTLTNEQTWRCAGISKMTFYKYKKELIENRIK